MKKITFKQFMLTYNFYANDPNMPSEDNDTQIIRIQLNDAIAKKYANDTMYWNTWFEFGLKSTFNDSVTEALINSIFTDRILNSYVSSIRTLENGVLLISLGVDENE